MSRRLANQDNESQSPRIPDSRIIFESGPFRLSAVSANRFVASIGNLHHTLTGGQAQQMFEALSDHFRKADGEKVIDWHSIRHFEQDEEVLAKFHDECRSAYIERNYGGKDDWK